MIESVAFRIPYLAKNQIVITEVFTFFDKANMLKIIALCCQVEAGRPFCHFGVFLQDFFFFFVESIKVLQ